MKHNDQNNPWYFFDRIYCISLADRTDRRQEALRQFDRIGIASRVEFIIRTRDPHNCERGIFEAHLQGIRKGLAAGARHMALFEDDVIFERYSSAKLAQCVEFLKTRKDDWRAFFFGCLVKGSRKTRNPAVLKVSYRCLAHAYALNYAFACSLAQKTWQQTPYDVMLSRFSDGYFAVYPSFAFQSDAASDNIRHHRLEGFRRRLGGLKRIQKANEWCHRHRLLLLTLHAVALVLLLLVVVRYH